MWLIVIFFFNPAVFWCFSKSSTFSALLFSSSSPTTCVPVAVLSLHLFLFPILRACFSSSPATFHISSPTLLLLLRLILFLLIQLLLLFHLSILYCFLVPTFLPSLSPSYPLFFLLSSYSSCSPLLFIFFFWSLPSIRFALFPTLPSQSVTLPSEWLKSCDGLSEARRVLGLANTSVGHPGISPDAVEIGG